MDTSKAGAVSAPGCRSGGRFFRDGPAGSTIMTNRLTRFLTASAMLSLLAGCASAPANGVDTSASTTVEVENQSFFDMTVYVFESGRRVRLGSVPGLTTRTFPIPDRLIFGVSALRFQIDPLGGDRSPLTQEITVVEGDALRLIIPPR